MQSLCTFCVNAITEVPQHLNQFLFSLCFVPFPINCSYECSSTPPCLPSNHTHPFILSYTSSCTFLNTSHYTVYLLKMHILHLYKRTHRSFKGNVIGTVPFYFHIQHINLFPVKLAFHFSLKSHILCLCCCIFRLNAPAKSTSYHNLHNQLLPSHHTRSGTHWKTTNLTPTAPKTLTYEHTLNADFGSCTCDTAIYAVLEVYV